MQGITQKLAIRPQNLLHMIGVTVLLVWLSLSLLSGVVHAATANVKWNADSSMTFKGKTYSVLKGDTGNASNSQTILLTAQDANAGCPSTEIVFAPGVNIKTAKSATYQVNALPACIARSTIKLNITNTRPDSTTSGTGSPTGGLVQDGSQQPSAADLASCSTADGYQPDPALCGTPCKDANNCDLTTKYINPIINKFLAPLAILAVIIGVIWGAIQYIMSAGDAQKVAEGKSKIQKALLGLVAFVFLYALLNWLIPGGLL